MNNEQEELFYTIALTQVPGVGNILARQMIECIGSAKKVFEELPTIGTTLRGVGATIVTEIQRKEPLIRAEQEMEFVERHRIQTITFRDEHYPSMLLDLNDAPVVIYYRGSIPLNSERSYSIIGTRKPTNYGIDFTQQFVSETAHLANHPTVVSGLAYGIDIESHKAALESGSPTIAVLAHGLDRIYPAAHRNHARKIVEQGGLLTEYASGTQPERYNFVARNRIVATLTRSTIVIESAEKGGSLITASIASSYGRELFSVPGRVNDASSRGCLQLMASNKAHTLISAEQFVNEMGWKEEGLSIKKEARLFDTPSIEARHRPLYEYLQKKGATHINTLSTNVGMSIQQLSVSLLEMEFNGTVRALPGGCYELKHSVC